MTIGLDVQAEALAGGSPVIPRVWTPIALSTINTQDWVALPRQMTIQQARLLNASGRADAVFRSYVARLTSWMAGSPSQQCERSWPMLSSEPEAKPRGHAITASPAPRSRRP